MIGQQTIKDVAEQHTKVKLTSLAIFDKLHISICSSLIVTIIFCIIQLYSENWGFEKDIILNVPLYKIILGSLVILINNKLRKLNKDVNSIIICNIISTSLLLSSSQQLFYIIAGLTSIGAYLYYHIIVVAILSILLLKRKMLLKLVLLSSLFSTIDYLFIIFYKIAYNMVDKQEFVQDIILMCNSVVIKVIVVILCIRTVEVIKKLIAYHNYKNTKLHSYKTAAETDNLTGLSNRRAFDLDLDILVKTRPENISIAMFDIDYFKNFNDTYGHQTGDDVLRKVGEIIGEFNRQIDIESYRYGGEELLIIFADQTPILELAQQLEIFRKRISMIRIPNVNESITISGGLVTANIDNTLDNASYKEQILNLVHAADEQLYKAKDTGRNKLCWTYN